MNEECIEKNKNEIISLLESTNREGIDRVIEFLNKSGYFYLYGSFNHHKYKGGLAEHSLGVYKIALKFNRNCDKNSVIISSLLHDICKTKYAFPDGIEYKGHGSKSVAILEDYLSFKLTDEERRAIRFHMHGDIKRWLREEKYEYLKARKEELRTLIYKSDKIDAGGYEDSRQRYVWNFLS